MVDNFITFEEIEVEEDKDEGEAAVTIFIHKDGHVSFKAALPGPAELLWLLKKVEKGILEDYIA